MKGMISFGVSAFLFSPMALAAADVTLSGPTPVIAPFYGAGITSTVTYTLTNTKSSRFDLSITGIAGPLNRTTVINDCGNIIRPGTSKKPSTCNIGIAITPIPTQVGSTISQTLRVSYNSNKTTLTSPISFKVNNAYAYIANFYNSTVLQCPVDPSSGLLNSGCVDSGAGATFFNPTDIHISPFGTNKFAYIVSYTNNSIFKCTVDPITGQLGSCGDSGAGNQFSHSLGMTFYSTANGNTYAYVVNGGTNQVLRCPVNASTGMFGTCVDSGTGPVFPGMPYLNAGLYIAFNTTTSSGKTYVYVSEGNTGIKLITQCLVDTTTGLFSNCVNNDVGYIISGIAFANQSVAYIVNFIDNNLYTCSVDGQNGLFSCANPIPGGWGSISVATVGGNKLLYSPNGYNGNSLTQCLIDPQTGALSACQDTAVGASFSAPFSIDFS